MSQAIKTLVSKKKLRHVEGQFNLDLSYINDHVIAMGFPAENIEAIYRNSLDDVKKFLDIKHRDHYWIYNLCSERIYDKNKFHGRVTCYPFEDHHPPEFKIIRPFCEEASKFLAEDDRNVAVVHCKAGKGRTGVMVCCYLLHCGLCKSADEVLQYYARMRTSDEKGVTIPSQRRYITYYDAMIRRELTYRPVKLYLRDIVLDPVPNFQSSFNTNCYMSFEIRMRNRAHPYESRCHVVRKGARTVSLQVEPPLLLTEDAKFEFSTKPMLDSIFGMSASAKINKISKAEKVFHFWLNTFFVDEMARGEPDFEPKVHVHHPSGSSEDSDDFPAFGRNGITSSCPASRQTSLLVAAAGEARRHDDVTNLMKHASISDDHLLQERRALQAQLDRGCEASSTREEDGRNEPGGNNIRNSCSSATTVESFNQQRSRHSSVPQTARVPSAMAHVTHVVSAGNGSQQQATNNYPVHSTVTSNTTTTQSAQRLKIAGRNLSLRLTKHEIDKAAKDKSCKTFAENFSVRLFFVRPDDQNTPLDYSLYQSHAALLEAGAAANSNQLANSNGCSKERQFAVVPVAECRQPAGGARARNRPLAGDSCASGSTPSLKSTEQSSPDSSSDEIQAVTTGNKVADKKQKHSSVTQSTWI